MSDGEVKKQAAGMKHMIVPELTTVAEVDGKPVGTMFGLLDYNPRIKEIDGRLLPFGFLKLHPQSQGAQAGAADQHQRAAGVPELGHRHRAWSPGWCPTRWRGASRRRSFPGCWRVNDLSFKTLKKGGAKITKQYRVYDFGPPDTTANAKFMPPPPGAPPA